MARDYFSLFNVEPGFTIDEIALEQVYHSLLSQFHPDRYAGKPQVEQRVAAQLCADINAGYRTLQARSVEPNTYCNTMASIFKQPNGKALGRIF